MLAAPALTLATPTLAAELDTPWVTLRMSPPTLPYLMSSDTPSLTSLRRPMGFPRKSTEPRIWAAWLISSCTQNSSSVSTREPPGGNPAQRAPLPPGGPPTSRKCLRMSLRMISCVS